MQVQNIRAQAFFHLFIRQDNMDQINIQVLSSHLRQRRDAGWDNLDNCPRTCPSEDLCLQLRSCKSGLPGL